MKLTFALVSVVQFVTDDLVAVVVVAAAVVTVGRDAFADVCAVFAAYGSRHDPPNRTRHLPDRCRQLNRFSSDDYCSLNADKGRREKIGLEFDFRADAGTEHYILRKR